MSDFKQQKDFCRDYYNSPDADFYEAVKRKGWLADPLVQELFRRLLDAPGRFDAMAARDINAAAQAMLEAQKVKAWAEARQRMAPVLEVEEAAQPGAIYRPGRDGGIAKFLAGQIKAHGRQRRKTLVAIGVAAGLDRKSISKAIGRELEYQDGQFKLVNGDLIDLKAP